MFEIDSKTNVIVAVSVNAPKNKWKRSKHSAGLIVKRQSAKQQIIHRENNKANVENYKWKYSVNEFLLKKKDTDVCIFW